jgi:hypothetical protein
LSPAPDFAPTPETLFWSPHRPSRAPANRVTERRRLFDGRDRDYIIADMTADPARSDRP